MKMWQYDDGLGHLLKQPSIDFRKSDGDENGHNHGGDDEQSVQKNGVERHLEECVGAEEGLKIHEADELASPQPFRGTVPLEGGEQIDERAVCEDTEPQNRRNAQQAQIGIVTDIVRNP